MKKYKIIYWLGGNKLKMTIEAESMTQAITMFYASNLANGHIDSIEEVKENV